MPELSIVDTNSYTRKHALAPFATMPLVENIPDIEFPANLEPIRSLGQGSMASVFLARDRTLKRMVAIKFLHPELSRIEQSRLRFEREAQAAARLSHESVTTIYSVGRLKDGVPYIEMEYVDGNNLDELMHSRGTFPVSESCSILAQIASALSAAHEQSIVHRDIKPANIIVDNSSHAAILTDFGVAAILQTGDTEVTRLTRDGELLGEPRYASPEQLRGEPLTGQSDVYSLGVIGYEMLTGSGPFDNAETRDMAAAHLRKPPPELMDRRAGIPQAVADVLKKCLSKKPEHRPRAKDLEYVLRHADDDENEREENTVTGASPGFVDELKQRKVYRAAAAYAAITFVLLQVIDLLIQPWPELGIVYQAAVIACIAGFPVTVVLAWIFDLRRGKLVRTDSDRSEGSPSKAAARRRVFIVAGLATAATIAAVSLWQIFGS